MQGTCLVVSVARRRRGRGWGVAVAVLFGSAFCPVAQAVPVVSLVTGEVEKITVDNPRDVWSGGKVVRLPYDRSRCVTVVSCEMEVGMVVSPWCDLTNMVNW